MTVDQLHSTYNNNCYETISKPSSKPSLTNRSISPSLRRKIRQTYEQINRLLFDEWKSVVDGWSSPSSTTDMPSLSLISIGPSFSQSRELYILNIRSLLTTSISATKDGDGTSATLTPSSTASRKLESTLTRRLLSTLLNGADDDTSPLQELPSKASASFRLWIILGVMNNKKKQQQQQPVVENENQDSNTNISNQLDNNTSSSWCIPRPNGCPLPRRGRQRQRHHSTKQRKYSCSSSGIVSIHIYKKEDKSKNDDKTSVETNGNIVFLDQHDVLHTASSSDQITWVSLPTCLKGFRL